jgi:tetratricopeptide (TPR) repeat protein
VHAPEIVEGHRELFDRDRLFMLLLVDPDLRRIFSCLDDPSRYASEYDALAVRASSVEGEVAGRYFEMAWLSALLGDRQRAAREARIAAALEPPRHWSGPLLARPSQVSAAQLLRRGRVLREAGKLEEARGLFLAAGGEGLFQIRLLDLLLGEWRREDEELLGALMVGSWGMRRPPRFDIGVNYSVEYLSVDRERGLRYDEPSAKEKFRGSELLRRGCQLKAEGRDEAAAAWQQALGEDPECLAAYLLLAGWLEGRGRLDAALLYRARAARIAPDDVEVWSALSRGFVLRYEQGHCFSDLQRAVEAMDRAASLEPGLAVGRDQLRARLDLMLVEALGP